MLLLSSGPITGYDLRSAPVLGTGTEHFPLGFAGGGGGSFTGSGRRALGGITVQDAEVSCLFCWGERLYPYIRD